jgi:hypothetical protein
VVREIGGEERKRYLILIDGVLGVLGREGFFPRRFG